MRTIKSDSFIRLIPLKVGDFSPQKKLFYPDFSMHWQAKPMKLSKPAIYRTILMEVSTQIEKNKLSPKNTKPEVCGHFSNMVSAAIWKISETL
jgi:hypothetical protein